MTRFKWKLVLVRLELVRILTQDRCMVCDERTIGSKIVLNALDGILRDMGHVESRSGCLDMVLVLVQDRCTVCAKHTKGLDSV